MIGVENLNVAYDGRYAVLDATFRVRPGQIVGLAGPNGAGKSSLIQALMGLIDPENGHVQINGVGLPPASAMCRRNKTLPSAFQSACGMLSAWVNMAS